MARHTPSRKRSTRRPSESAESALRAIAQQAIKRGTGARGLRAVIEESMLDVMYEIPSRADVIGCTISRECIIGGAPPLLTFRGEREKRRKEA